MRFSFTLVKPAYIVCRSSHWHCRSTTCRPIMAISGKFSGVTSPKFWNRVLVCQSLSPTLCHLWSDKTIGHSTLAKFFAFYYIVLDLVALINTFLHNFDIYIDGILATKAKMFGLVWLYDDLFPRRLSTFTRLGDSVTVHPAIYPKCVGAQPLWGSSSPSITLLSYFLP